jgi:hypothetical protein
MAVTTLDPVTALIVVDLQRGIVGTPSVRSMGGRLMPPLSSMEQSGSKGLSAANFCCSSVASATRAMRKSTSAHASAAITLLRVPPWITPGFTVMPRPTSLNFTISSSWRASSTIALRPFSKSTPECDARPRTRMVMSPTPLREVFK